MSLAIYANGIPQPYDGMLVKFRGQVPMVISSVRRGSVLVYRLKGRPNISSWCSTEAQWCLLWNMHKGRIIQYEDLTPQSKIRLDEITSRKTPEVKEEIDES